MGSFLDRLEDYATSRQSTAASTNTTVSTAEEKEKEKDRETTPPSTLQTLDLGGTDIPPSTLPTSPPAPPVTSSLLSLHLAGNTFDGGENTTLLASLLAHHAPCLHTLALRYANLPAATTSTPS